MDLNLYDWRSGSVPRDEVIEYFKSKGYLRTSPAFNEHGESYTVYSIEVESTAMGRVLEELMVRYDIMFWNGFFCIDTKGYKFTQR